jgi:hypothetical protein
MNLPFQIDVNIRGRYCEILAAAAFISKGIDIAVPWGNSKGWDLLADDDGWKRVQVKAARPGKTSGVWVNVAKHGNRNKNGERQRMRYTKNDIDLFVIVLPESGEMWKIPVDHPDLPETLTIGKANLDQFLWIKGVDQRELSAPVAIDTVYNKRDSRLRRIFRGLDLDKDVIPNGVSESTWKMLWMCLDGHTYKAIGEASGGLDSSSVRERLTRALAHIKGKEFSHYMGLKGVLENTK